MFAKKHLLAAILIPFLSGCTQHYLFGPAQYGSSDHLEFKDRTRGGLMGDAAAAFYERSTEGVIVGWEHFYDGSRIHNHIYRGAVRFNVGLLGEPPKKTITKATLSYKIQSGAKTGGGFIESCASRLLLATGDWTGIPSVDIGKAPATIPGDAFKTLVEAPLGSVMKVDVTAVVKDWVSGKRKNKGFVFAGSPEAHGLHADNNVCWTLLEDITLRIDYTKP